MFKCFVEETLHIDDVVVYLKNIRTGSSTIRKCKFVGQVIGFTKSKVKITQFSKPNQWVTPNMCCNYGEDEVCPDDVICIIISKSEGDMNAKSADGQG